MNVERGILPDQLLDPRRPAQRGRAVRTPRKKINADVVNADGYPIV